MADIPPTGQEDTYSSTARGFHWWTVALVALQVPLGLYMAFRGNVQGIFDATTNFLYSSHKTIGLVILFLVIARLIYRIAHGAPRDEPTITTWQKGASHATHWMLYLLLLTVPILGYLGVSLYPSLGLFDVVTLPGIVAPDQEAAGTVLYYHWLAAVVLVLLVGVHVAGALFHYFIRKDGVLARIWPGAGRRDIA
jgi:cytochrome b561